MVRPSNKWTRDVHRFLQYLHEKGASFVPEPVGINNKNEEIITFMPGDVFNYPLPEKLLQDTMLVSAAKLLLKFHTYSEKYITELTDTEQWMLPAVLPAEVLCHGDFAPYNVTVIGNEAVGMIDFDTLHPGPKMWDIAYAVYRWVPFNNPCNTGSQGTLQEHIRKAKLFLDAYGVSLECRNSFVSILIRRLVSLVDYMRHQADRGNEDFQVHIKEGHLQLYLHDIEYLRINETEITNGISTACKLFQISQCPHLCLSFHVIVYIIIEPMPSRHKYPAIGQRFIFIRAKKTRLTSSLIDYFSNQRLCQYASSACPMGLFNFSKKVYSGRIIRASAPAISAQQAS